MAETQRMRLDLAYDGSYFHGWARQPGLRTVQGVLEEALETVLQRPVPLTVAGRTDAGVHAVAQVAHFDASPAEVGKISAKRLQGLLSHEYARLWGREAIRKYLTSTEATARVCDVLIRGVTPVASTFDARFSATARHYEYRVSGADAQRNPLTRGQTWWAAHRLDQERMVGAAQLLRGEHDFLSFCRPRQGATTIRTLENIQVSAESSGEVVLRFSADAFCHSMVRSLVGALVEVGRGHRNESWIRALISQPNRSWGVPVAPARGLTLAGVDYPEPSRWQSRAEQARQRRTR